MTATFWHPAYIALGGNLDQPQMQVLRALNELAGLRCSRLLLRSSLYRSAPMGPQDQPEFVNAVAGVLTQLSELDLLIELQAIETRMGRTRPAAKWGSRVIDLDLLLYLQAGNAVRSETSQLSLPHPGLAERNFVATPLAEIAPELKVPGQGNATALARRLGVVGLVRLT